MRGAGCLQSSSNFCRLDYHFENEVADVFHVFQPYTVVCGFFCSQFTRLHVKGQVHCDSLKNEAIFKDSFLRRYNI